MRTTDIPRRVGRSLTTAEARAVKALAPQPGTAAATVVSTIGKLGDQPELRTISAVVIAGGLLTGNRRLVRAGVRMLLAHELTTLAKDVIKRRIDRTRPHSASSPAERRVKPGRHTAKTKTSFPSGHSGGAVAVARALAREYPEHQAPALAAAGAVAVMQVPRLNHYPTDIAAGMLLGTACEAVAHLVIGPADNSPDQATASQRDAASSPRFK